MEVSQLAQLDTHAVIGGDAPRSFGMADTAEFYHMLSASIYRDKNRAVVRETICNGWDAHIMAGKTDVPVQVTLTDEEMIFKDFGPGIPDELMAPIFCVYGQSTKVKDENQTGGFGLGSKSPFAVTDHFSAVSCFQGTRSVYAISKGGKATDGKPDLRRMVAVPTTETGVTITIPIKKEERRDFEGHIRAVAQQGGMLVALNGELLPRFDYDQARKTEFCVVQNDGLSESRVYVLYGTVLYPLTTTAENIYHEAEDVAGKIGWGGRLIVIAPPNSVEVTPSRESLSYTEGTTATIKRLLEKASIRIGHALTRAAKPAVVAQLTEYGRNAISARIVSNKTWPVGVLSTADAIAQHTIRCNADKFIAYSEQKRLAMKAAQRLFKDDRRIFRRAVKIGYDSGVDSFRTSVKPIVRIASKMGLLKDAYLFDAYKARYDVTGSKTNPLREHSEGTVHPILCVARNLRDLRPTLSIAAKAALRNPERGEYIAGYVMRQWSGERLKRLREFADHYKLTLHVFDYETKKEKAPAVKRVKVADKYFGLADFRGNLSLEVPKLENPKYYLMSFMVRGKMRIPFNDEASGNAFPIAALYPETAVISSKVDAEKLEKAGAVNLTGMLTKRLTELAQLREVQYAWAIRQREMIMGGYHQHPADLAKDFAQADVRLAKLLFPDKVTPGEDAKIALNIYDALVTLRSDYQDKELARSIGTATYELRKKSAETYKPMTSSYADKKFAYLEVLAGVRLSSREKIDSLVEIIRFLQIKASKSKLIEMNTANTEKEAA